MIKNQTIEVTGSIIAVVKQNGDDYISLTDLAKHKNAEHTGVVISHWMSTRYTIEFMGIWERVNNPHFNLTEFSYIRNESGGNLESINAMLIHQGLNQSQRISQLNSMAISQMRSLLAIGNVQGKLENKP